MGLLKAILTLPVSPLTGTVTVAEQVLKQAEKQFYDPAGIRAELEEVARLREEGTVSDDEATAWEDELVERLMIGQQRATEEFYG